MYYIFLVLYVIVISIALFLFICADVDDQGIIGNISRFLQQTIPNHASSFVYRLLGEKLHGKITNVIDYIINKRNPLLQVHTIYSFMFLISV